LSLALGDEFEVCDVCAVVDTDQERIKLGHPCSMCGFPSTGGTLYFGLPVNILTNLIYEEGESDARKIRVDSGPKPRPRATAHEIATVVFFCTLGEVLLEHFLKELMIAHRIPRGAMKRLLDDNLYPKRRIDKLFPALTGRKWKDAIQDLGRQHELPFGDANQFYLRAAAARNSFLHKGNRWAIRPGMQAECVTQTTTLILLFAALHNLFVRPFYGPQRPYLSPPSGA
jgi:hypothetical protein